MGGIQLWFHHRWARWGAVDLHPGFGERVLKTRTIPETQFLELFEKSIYMESVMARLGAATPKEVLEKVMCYGNCPHENWHGDCIRPRLQNKPGSHCFEVIDPENEIPTDYFVEVEGGSGAALFDAQGG